MTHNRSKWKIIDEHVYESFPIFTIKRSRRVNPVSGKAIDFVRVDGLDWVNVMAFTPDDRIVMVKQYRHGCEDYTLELPGGCIDVNEDPKASGKRELLEETGYTCGELTHLGTLLPNPAMYSMKNFLYTARGAELVAPQTLDSGEDIEIVLVPFEELKDGVVSGRINHWSAAAALGLYLMKQPG